MVHMIIDHTEETEKYMEEAGVVARSALCLKAKCGTVIVKDGVIIGKGYNAPPLDDVNNRMCLDVYDFTGKPKYDHTCCMHSEWRAILDATRKNPKKLKGSKLFFVRIDENNKTKRSGKPYCTVCSRFALDVGIAEFYLWHEEGITSYPTDEYNRLSYDYKVS
jgi:deoxycytidylate deaminase